MADADLMKRFIITAAGIAALLSIALVAIFKPNGDVGAFIQHPATASWAQLFGALGAIAATWIAGRDALAASQKALKKADRDHMDRAMRSLITGAAYLRSAVNDAAVETRKNNWGQANLRMIKADLVGAVGVLKTIRLEELPNAKLVSKGISLQKMGFRAEVFLEAVGNSVEMEKAFPADGFDDFVEKIATTCEELDRDVKDVRDEFKSSPI